MLVLSRRRGEKIVINDGEITVMVIEVRGDTVRIGIDAPDDMPIHREEVFNAIRRDGDGGDSAAVDSEPNRTPPAITSSLSGPHDS